MPSSNVSNIATQINEITQHLSGYPTSHIAQTGMTHLIICCPDGAIAKTLASELAALGYAAIVRRGRLTSHYYIQAPFNLK